ncbi:MAG: hypothetical protein P8102_09830 [Gammaproteobacteria bacterium]
MRLVALAVVLTTILVSGCGRQSNSLHLLCKGFAESQGDGASGEHGLEIRLDTASGEVFYLREKEPERPNREPRIANVSVQLSDAEIRIVTQHPERSYRISRSDGSYSGNAPAGETPEMTFSGRCFSPRGDAF